MLVEDAAETVVLVQVDGRVLLENNHVAADAARCLRLAAPSLPVLTEWVWVLVREECSSCDVVVGSLLSPRVAAKASDAGGGLLKACPR